MKHTREITETPHYNIAQNVQSLLPSATLVINELSRNLKKEGKIIYSLGFGQSPFPIPQEVAQSLQDNAYRKDYLPVQGLLTLREAVAEFNKRTLQIPCKAENILIGPGSKELIYQLQLALNCTLVLPSPSWVSYAPQAQLADQKVAWIDTHEEYNYCLQAQDLDNFCKNSPDTPKLLILNYPNNPTGSTYSIELLEALADVAKKHKILILSDEIYGELAHQGQHTSIAKFYQEGTIVSSGLSKWCGAGGWRLGTFTFPSNLAPILKRMATIASETFTSVSTPVQYAAITAFQGSKAIDEYLHHSRKILSTIGDYVYRRLIAMHLTMPMPEGGFYLFPNFEYYRKKLSERNILDATILCHTLLQETGIALLPSKAFGRPNEELTVRLSFVDFDGEKLLEIFKNNNQSIDDAFIEKHFDKIATAMNILQDFLERLEA